MPCCAVLMVMFALPRLALFILWLNGYLFSAYQTSIIPLLGFFFMPYTTLGYAWAMHNGGMQGLGLIVFIFMLLVDLGVVGGGARNRQQRKRDNVDENGLKRVN